MSRHVMVVDDEPAIVRLITNILSTEGYAYSFYSNAEDAMRALRTGTHPDIVLVDLWLPGANGDRLCREIARLEIGVPCVVMSAVPNADEVAAELGLRLLKKPFGVDELLTAVESPQRIEFEEPKLTA